MNKRTCIVTKVVTDKENLIKVTKTKDGEFFVNSDIKGRGAYISKNAPIEKLIKLKSLHKAFRTNVPNEIYEKVVSILKGE